MSEQVEFGTKPAADTARNEFSEHVCPVDDDKRLKTVAWVSDAPDEVMQQIHRRAEDSRQGEASAGQVNLSDSERERIDFSEGRANVPHAKSVKGIALSEGVDDWVAYYDPTLTVDEHRQVMGEAAQEGGGRRLDEDDDPANRAAEASRTAMSEECDHAADHCKHGDPDACEFIREQCDLDPDRVLGRADPPSEGGADPTGEGSAAPVESESGEGSDLPGPALAALGRAWSGYQGGVEAVEEALEGVREEWEHAQAAAKAINEIRADHGQPPLHFTKLEEAQADLTDLLRKAANDCTECHADHGEHDHDVTSGNRETLKGVVDGSAAETPVGRSTDS